MEGWRNSENWWKFSHLSMQLATAIKNEDADKFLEIYDDVMPKNLTPKQVEEIKEKARDLAVLPNEDFLQLEVQLQAPNAIDSKKHIQQLTDLRSTSKLESTNPNHTLCINEPVEKCEVVTDNFVQFKHQKSSLDIKNSLDLNACERTKPVEVRATIPGPHFIASGPSDISLTYRPNFVLCCKELNGIDNDSHMTDTYSKISIANHGDYQNTINYTSDESTDSLTFRERSLSFEDFGYSSNPSYDEIGSKVLTTLDKLTERNRQSQQSRYRQSSFTLVTDVKENVQVDNEQVKNNPENTRKRKKKKKKGKSNKMDDSSKSDKGGSIDVSAPIVFDMFSQNNVKKVNVEGAVDRNKTAIKMLSNECGSKQMENIGIDATKHNVVVNDLKRDGGKCESDPDELREIIIDKSKSKSTETSGLCSNDSSKRRYDTFSQPPFDYPPNPDKLTQSAMSLIDDKPKEIQEIEMQVMTSSLETPIQNDPRRKVHTTRYMEPAGKPIRDLKSILKSTSSGVCDGNVIIPAASVKERFDDMRSFSNNHCILSDEHVGDAEGNKKTKKSKKKKKKDDDTVEDDSAVKEPERKPKSALAPRKDTSIETQMRDYPNDHDNEPCLTADGIRNIDKLGTKNCRTKKKREMTASIPHSIITNRNERVRRRLQGKLNAKSNHNSAIDKQSYTNMKLEYHVVTNNYSRLNNSDNKRKKTPQDIGKKSAVKEENKLYWITDPATISMLGLTDNNNKEKKSQKKKKKTVDSKKDFDNEDDGDLEDIKAKDLSTNIQTETLRKSASFDIEENASSSEEDNDEIEFQVVQSKKKKAAKKRVIFEDKSASFPRNMVPTYPKEKGPLVSGNLRKCKSEPNNVTLVQDDVEGVCTSLGGTGTSSGSHSSASSISTESPSSQSYLEMAVVLQPTPNTEPTPHFEFSYASKVKGASPKNEQTNTNKLTKENFANSMGGCKESGSVTDNIEAEVEDAGLSAPEKFNEDSVEIPFKGIVTKSVHTGLQINNELSDKINAKNVLEAPSEKIEPQILSNPIKKADKKKRIGNDVLVNGINTELINSLGDKSSKFPGISSDSGSIGITFGSIVFHNDNSFSLDDNEDNRVSGNTEYTNSVPSPVVNYNTSEPSTVITCTALENSLVRGGKCETTKRKSYQELKAVNNVGSFNHITIAKFLQKEWEKVLEEEAKNPDCVVHL